jgi:WD40 repeat protein
VHAQKYRIAHTHQMATLLREVSPECDVNSNLLTRFIACQDGALHLWNTNSNFARPDRTIEGAHMKSAETGSIVFSVDGRTILTRSGDDTVKCMTRLSSSSHTY